MRVRDSMNGHKKKMVAPIVVTVILVLYYAAYFGLLFSILPGTMKYVFGIVPLVLVPLTIKVCVERIKEIRKGETDDIGKY